MTATLDPADVRTAAAYAGCWLAFRRRLLRVPGVQAAVWHEDGLVLSGAYGQADLAAGIPLTQRSPVPDRVALEDLHGDRGAAAASTPAGWAWTTAWALLPA